MFTPHTTPEVIETDAPSLAPDFIATQLLAERETAPDWAWVAEHPDVCQLDASRQYPVVLHLVAMALLVAFGLGLLALFNANSTIADTQFVAAMGQLGAPVERVTNGFGWAGLGAIGASVLALSLLALLVKRFVSGATANKVDA